MKSSFEDEWASFRRRQLSQYKDGKKLSPIMDDPTQKLIDENDFNKNSLY